MNKLPLKTLKRRKTRAMAQNFVAVGVFHDAEQAKHAIDELKMPVIVKTHHYQCELEKGHTIETVKATGGYDEVIAIMHRDGAKDAKIRSSEFNAEPPIRPYGSNMPPEGE